MNMLIVNGKTASVDMGPEKTWEDLLKIVRKRWLEKEQIISSIRIDGIEFNVEDEEELYGLLLQDINQVEIQTCTPRELAADSLRTLESFMLTIVQLCQEASQETESSRFEKLFLRIVDGVQIVADTVSACKITLRTSIIPSVNLLEADLVSTLKDLVESKERNEIDIVKNILSHRLAENLMNWSLEGIPEIVSEAGLADPISS